ncbi:unnamed protein product, partial [marine sediment metagenome]
MKDKDIIKDLREELKTSKLTVKNMKELFDRESLTRRDRISSLEAENRRLVETNKNNNSLLRLNTELKQQNTAIRDLLEKKGEESEKLVRNISSIATHLKEELRIEKEKSDELIQQRSEDEKGKKIEVLEEAAQFLNSNNVSLLSALKREREDLKKERESHKETKLELTKFKDIIPQPKKPKKPNIFVRFFNFISKLFSKKPKPNSLPTVEQFVGSPVIDLKIHRPVGNNLQRRINENMAASEQAIEDIDKPFVSPAEDSQIQESEGMLGAVLDIEGRI